MLRGYPRSGVFHSTPGCIMLAAALSAAVYSRTKGRQTSHSSSEVFKMTLLKLGSVLTETKSVTGPDIDHLGGQE